MRRVIKYTEEYKTFYDSVNKRTQEKLKYAINILETIDIIPIKFVKKLTNSDFYELRISTDNEIRVIIFTIDNDNINQAQKVILLNGFIKKDTKDYYQHIEKAITILRKEIL